MALLGLVLYVPLLRDCSVSPHSPLLMWSSLWQLARSTCYALRYLSYYVEGTLVFVLWHEHYLMTEGTFA